MHCSLGLAGAFATLVLNEVLYDPPGPDAGHEFVEILNVSSTPVSLAGIELLAGDGAHPGTWRSVWRGREGALAPGALLVVGGDSVAVPPSRLAGELQNGPDALRLLSGSAELDRLGYGALSDSTLFESRPAPDVSGMSLSRIPDGSDTQDNAADFTSTMPTPGRRNRPQRAWRLRLLLPDPARLWPGRRLHARARLLREGEEPLRADAWSLRAALRPFVGEPYLREEALGPPATIEAHTEPLGGSDADSLGFDVAWSGERGLFQLEVEALQVPGDTVTSRAVAALRVGSGAVLVNEIQYAPLAGQVEWLELWNRDGRAHDLNGWTLRDASGHPARLKASRVLEAGGFALLSADSTRPIASQSAAALRCVASPWPSLNNSNGSDGYADRLELRDPSGMVQDALLYQALDGSGHGRTLERLTPDADVHGVLWAPSKSPSGSTPGRANSATSPPAPRVGLRLAPNPFAPDRAETLGIALEVPQGCSGFRATLFDLTGRPLRVLAADRLGPGPRHLLWDGNDGDGHPVPKGAYVLHLELYSNRDAPRRELRTIGVVRP